MKTDLTYKTEGLFTSFYPETPAGDQAIGELMAVNGNNKILTIFAPQLLQALKEAGYSLRKAREAKQKMSDDQLLEELLK
jgi:hypothetical protein